MSTTTVTITIKDIPAEPLNKLWNDHMKWCIKTFQETVEPSNNIEFTFEQVFNAQPEVFYNIMAAAMTMQSINTLQSIHSNQ